MSSTPSPARSAEPPPAGVRVVRIAGWVLLVAAVLVAGCFAAVVRSDPDGISDDDGVVLAVTVGFAVGVAVFAVVVGVALVLAAGGRPAARAVAWVFAPLAFVLLLVPVAAAVALVGWGNLPGWGETAAFLSVPPVLVGVVAVAAGTVTLTLPPVGRYVRAQRPGPVTASTGRAALRVSWILLVVVLALLVGAAVLWALARGAMLDRATDWDRDDVISAFAGTQAVNALAFLPVLVVLIGTLLTARLRLWWLRRVTFGLGVVAMIFLPAALFWTLSAVVVVTKEEPGTYGSAATQDFAAVGLHWTAAVLYVVALLLLGLPSVSARTAATGGTARRG